MASTLLALRSRCSLGRLPVDGFIIALAAVLLTACRQALTLS